MNPFQTVTIDRRPLVIDRLVELPLTRDRDLSDLGTRSPEVRRIVIACANAGWMSLYIVDGRVYFDETEAAQFIEEEKQLVADIPGYEEEFSFSHVTCDD